MPLKGLALSGVCLAFFWPASSAGQTRDPATAEAATAGRPTAAQEVVVREKRRRPVSSRDRTAASTVVGREAFEAPGTSAADAVARAPGVQITKSGGGADLATASIRGASSAQTPVYLAGVRINDDVTGAADLSQVPLFMLDRIEIFRGNAPEHADRLGIGGAIFFEPRLPSTTRVGASAEIASFGRLSTSLGAAAAEDGQGSLFGISRTIAEDDYPYVNDGGTRFVPSDDRVVRRPNADSAAFDGWAIGRFALGPPGARATTVLNAYEREQGVTGLGVEPALFARGRTQRLLGAVDTRLPCSRTGAERCELELVTSGIVSENVLTDPLAELDAAPGTTSSKGRRLTLGMRSHHRVGQAGSVGFGLSEEIERLSIDRTSMSPLRARSAMTRLSATLGFPLGERFDVSALGALARQTSSGIEERESVFEPAGRVGLRFEATREVELLSNVGRYVRLPTLAERYGVAPLVRGNPALEPELGLSADFGVRGALEATGFELFVDGFVFGRSVSDLVGYRRSQLGYVRPYNVGRARLLGAELASRAVFFDHLWGELAITMLDPRDMSEDRQTSNDILPHQSRLVATGFTELFGAIAGLDRAGVGARVRYRSSRYADSAGLIVIPEELLFDLEASLSFWQRRAALRFAVENLFDREHFDLIGFPQPGRRFALGAELWWW